MNTICDIGQPWQSPTYSRNADQALTPVVQGILYIGIYIYLLLKVVAAKHLLATR